MRHFKGSSAQFHFALLITVFLSLVYTNCGISTLQSPGPKEQNNSLDQLPLLYDSERSFRDQAIDFVVQQQIMNLDDNGDFQEDTQVIRGDAIIILKRAFPDLPPLEEEIEFQDIDSYSDPEALREALRFVPTGGCSTFSATVCPNRELTRAETAAWLSRTIGFTKSTTNLVFTDIPEGAWYENVLKKAFSQGYFLPCEAFKLCPERTSTRAELAEVIFAALNSSVRFPIHGTFVILDNGWHRHFLTSTQWEEEFRQMRYLGISQIFVLYAVLEKIENNQRILVAAYPNSSITPHKASDTSQFEKIFQAANKYGIDVHLGLIQKVRHWEDPTWHDNAGTQMASVARDLENLYGHHDSLKGYYVAQEPTLNWDLKKSFFVDAAAKINAVNPHRSLTFSPGVTLSDHNTCVDDVSTVSIETFRQHLQSFVDNVPVGRVFLQDAIGARKIHMDQLAEVFRIGLDVAGERFGVNVETFELAPNCSTFIPGPSDRVLQQLDFAKQYTEGIINYEWFNELSPTNVGPTDKSLFTQYCKRYGGKLCE